MPTWVKAGLLVLGAAVVLVLPGLLRWMIDGRPDYAVVGAGGLLALAVVLMRWHRREHDRS